MVVVPLKERIIDYDKEVFVYRNLNRKGKWYSIKQDGLVVGYSKEVTLIDARGKGCHSCGGYDGIHRIDCMIMRSARNKKLK